jgi:hypothetical protein
LRVGGDIKALFLTATTGGSQNSSEQRRKS